jgi:hypothetical protein
MQIYFETLAETVNEILARAEADRLELADGPDEVCRVFSGHLAYGNDRSGNFYLRTIKGKPTRKYFHAQVHRMDSGRYELTTYVL